MCFDCCTNTTWVIMIHIYDMVIIIMLSDVH